MTKRQVTLTSSQHHHHSKQQVSDYPTLLVLQTSFPAYIETGNIRLAGNTFSTTSGALLIDPAGNEDITFNGEVIFNENAYFDINKVGSFNTAQTGSIDINLGQQQRRGGFNAYGLLSDTNLLISTEELSTVTVSQTGDGYTGGTSTLTLDTNPAVNGQASCTIDTNDGSLKTVTIGKCGFNFILHLLMLHSLQLVQQTLMLQ